MTYFIAALVIVFGLLTVSLLLIGIRLLSGRKKSEGTLVVKDVSQAQLGSSARILSVLSKKSKIKIPTPSLKGVVFALNFKGNITASQVESLRKEVSAIIKFAEDVERPYEVVLKLDSPGGTVTGYGLAASQLDRLRAKSIPLTICVDQVAASGGYMMASVANKILAPSFAIIGSIGVVMEFPNFSRLLRKFGVEYKQYTAGEYKRTISPFVPASVGAEEKTNEKLQETHDLFKKHIAKYRPHLDMSVVATGETWYGDDALKKGLVDELGTYDDYLMELGRKHRLLAVEYKQDVPVSRKVSLAMSAFVCDVATKFLDKVQAAEFEGK